MPMRLSSATTVRERGENGAGPSEMSTPLLFPGIEHWNYFVAHAAREIAPLCEVTTMAAPGQICEIVGSAVFPGDDVFDMKGVG